MAAFVVDVNVAMVANGKSPQADNECQLACIHALREVQQNMICLDTEDHILGQYRQSLSMSGQPGVGDEFMYWIYQNQCDEKVCERVLITPHPEKTFKEFPDDPSLAEFDRDERKYVAVALTSKKRPEILNAVDSDWLNFHEELSAAGLCIRQLCPDCLRENR